MKKENEEKILSLLGFASRARKIVVGTDHITDAIRSCAVTRKEEGSVHKNSPVVLIACDASGNTRKRIANCCAYYNAEYVDTGFTMELLSRRTGKGSGVSAVAVTDKGFAKSIRALLGETE